MSVEPPRADELDRLDRGLLAATALLVVTTVGKALLARFDAGLAVSGSIYLAACLVAPLVRAVFLRRLILLAALTTALTTFVLSGNATLLIVMPLIPLVARLESMRAAVIACVLLTAATVVISIAEKADAVTVFEYSGSFVGGAAFMLCYSLVMLQEREQRRVLVEQARITAELGASRERARITQEMHDGLGHYLSAALMQLEAGRMVSDAHKAQRATEQARGLIAEALRSLRSLVTLFAEPSQPAYLRDELMTLVNVHRDAGHATELVMTGTVARAPVAAAMLSVVRECLTNVRKHAPGATTRVVLDAQEDATVLSVSDNGPGPRELPVIEGVGLRGLRMKCESLGGALSFGQENGIGFVVEARVNA